MHKLTFVAVLLGLIQGPACTRMDPHTERVRVDSTTPVKHETRGLAATVPATESKERRKVVFISFAPSPYTNRHDCMRAGFAIYLLLNERVEQLDLPIDLHFYDGSLIFDNPSEITKIMELADVYVMGGSTWSQGPAYYVRRFFELGGVTNLMGVLATAWATAGGAHTGGSEVVSSFLRSLAGMGANVFTLGQKFMVFTTDERLTPAAPGAFSLLDLWYMDQFARTIAVKTLAGNSRERAKRLSRQLDVSPFYFQNTAAHPFPPPPESLNRYNRLRAMINAAANPDSTAWRTLQALLSKPPAAPSHPKSEPIVGRPQ